LDEKVGIHEMRGEMQSLKAEMEAIYQELKNNVSNLEGDIKTPGQAAVHPDADIQEHLS
jgi:hypothetical protein